MCQATPATAIFLRLTVNSESRQYLRSATSSSSILRRTCLSTVAVSDGGFPAAVGRTSNSLRQHVTSAFSISVSTAF